MAVVLLWSARGLQFRYDDWGLVSVLSAGRPSPEWFMAPVNEHWLLPTKAIYAVLYGVVGGSSAVPYVAFTIALHLCLCHVLWRTVIRAGGDPWLASWSVLGFAAFGAGVENILFPIQFGLLTTMVLTVVVFLELDRQEPRAWVVVITSLAMVISFATAPIFLGSAGLFVASLRRWSLLRMFVPAAVLYLGYVAHFGLGGEGPARAAGDLMLTAVFFVLGVGNAVASIVPWRFPAEGAISGLTPASTFAALLGFTVVVALWAMTCFRPSLKPNRLVEALAATTPLYFAATALPRIAHGVDGAVLSRYAYIGTAFLLPWFVVLASGVIGLGRGPVIPYAIRTVAALLAVANLLVFIPIARSWVDWSRTTTRIIAAGQDLVASIEQTVDAPSPEFAFLSPSGLDHLDTSAVRDEVNERDRLSARLGGQVLIERASGSLECVNGQQRGDVVLPIRRGSEYIVRVSRKMPFRVVLSDHQGNASHPRDMRLEPGRYRISSVSEGGDVSLRLTARAPLFADCSL